jgi:hypothetical protein
MLNTGYALHRGLAVVFLLSAGVSLAGAETIERRVPNVATIRIARELQPSVNAMLQTSPTFRQQFERIAAAPNLVVNARVDMTFLQRPFRARSCFRRYDSGLILVAMDIAPDAVQPEWIAHEFEHVLEQIEGLHLPALALLRRSGAWFSSGEMVETLRATRAGRVVREEMRGHRDRSDKFVE